MSYLLKPISYGCNFISGFAFKSCDFTNLANGIPVIKIKNISGSKVTIDNSQYIPESTITPNHKKYFVYNEDVLIAMTGAGSVGRVGMASFKDEGLAILNQRVGKIVSDEENVNKEYLFFILSSPRFQKILYDKGSGSGQPNLSPSGILELEIPMPPYNIQKSIGEILICQRRKIDLLCKQNQTLENIAQTLFKRWFVDFEFPNKDGKPYQSSGGRMVESEFGEIPEGWEVRKLENISKFQNGFAFYTIGYSDSGKKVVDLANIDPEGKFKETLRDKFISSDIYGAEKFEKYHLRKDDIVMAMTDITQEMGILGKCGKIYESNKFILNQRVGRIRVNRDINVNFLLTYLNSKYQTNYLKSCALGTVQKYVNTTHIKGMDLIIPSNKIMECFSELVDSIFHKIKNNDIEIETLTKTRDTLLPKLMSGQIRVKSL